jgi:hypothetical protein
MIAPFSDLLVSARTKQYRRRKIFQRADCVDSRILTIEKNNKEQNSLHHGARRLRCFRLLSRHGRIEAEVITFCNCALASSYLEHHNIANHNTTIIMLLSKNILLVLAATSSSVVALNVAEGSEGGLTIELMSKWKLWTDSHGKKYDSHETKMERMQVWVDNNGTYR